MPWLSFCCRLHFLWELAPSQAGPITPSSACWGLLALCKWLPSGPSTLLSHCPETTLALASADPEAVPSLRLPALCMPFKFPTVAPVADVISRALPRLIDRELLNHGGGAVHRCSSGSPCSKGKFSFFPGVLCSTPSGSAGNLGILREHAPSLLTQRLSPNTLECSSGVSLFEDSPHKQFSCWFYWGQPG